MALEAVRGIAALAVVLGHLSFVLCPGLWGTAHDTFLECLLASPPLAVLYNGSFAVRIFFVLSGVVLSHAFFRERDSARLGSALLRRYPRLAIPAATAVLLSYSLLSAGVLYNHVVADLLNRPADDWFRGMYGFAPSLRLALNEGVYSAFVSGESRYVPVLWTMSVEFQGSLLVYSFLAFFGSWRKRWTVYLGGVTCLVLARLPYLVDFVIGIALADFQVMTQRRWLELRLGNITAIALIALGLFLGSLRVSWIEEAGLSRGTGYVASIGAALIVGSVLLTPRVRHVLDARFATWLGKISFSLYLIHIPIMSSLGAWVFVVAYGQLRLGMATASILSAAVSISASCACAQLMSQTVEHWSIVFPRRLLETGIERGGQARSVGGESCALAREANRKTDRQSLEEPSASSVT